MNRMINMLIDETKDINYMINYLKELETKESLNILEIINIIVKYIIKNKIYDDLTLAMVLVELETIEHNISVGASSIIQICGIASALCKANKRLSNKKSSKKIAQT